jgi:hypothetical protein
MATPDLITGQDVSGFWPGFTALPSAEQAALLTDASRVFEEYTDRIFGSVTYLERKTSGRVRKLYMKQKPITSIARVAVDFGTVLTVQNVDQAVQEATIGYTSTGIPEDYPAFTGLTLGGISNGVPLSTISLPFATYPTIGGLVAAINTHTGWTASASTGAPNVIGGDFTLYPTSYLVGDMGQQQCTLLPVELKMYTRGLSYACDADMSRKGEIAIFEARPDGYRYPDRRYGSTSYGGIAGIAGGTDARIGDVQVLYTAGYAAANMPGDIRRACAGIAKFLYESGKFSIFQSETLAERSHTLKEWKRGLPDWILGIIDKHTRKEIFAGGP